jgi:hypothetical protein
MFAALQTDAGGVNVFRHNREPTSIDEGQTVIRMNRDTLYSFAIVDISEGATVTVPDSGDRYLSVMVVNQDQYINRIFHDGGEYELTLAEFDTPWVLIAYLGTLAHTRRVPPDVSPACRRTRMRTG